MCVCAVNPLVILVTTQEEAEGGMSSWCKKTIHEF